jgi:hypothetical protein
MKILEAICLTILGCGGIWILTLISIIGIGGILEHNLWYKVVGICCLGYFLLSGYVFAKESLYK